MRLSGWSENTEYNKQEEQGILLDSGNEAQYWISEANPSALLTAISGILTVHTFQVVDIFDK